MFVVLDKFFPAIYLTGKGASVESSRVVEIGSEWEGVRIGAKKIGGGIGKERGGRLRLSGRVRVDPRN